MEPGRVAARDGVSVVIPHWGDPELALAVVRDVLGQRSDRELEVVVVDDASPTSFPSTAGVTVVRRPSNGGFGAAVNTGVAATRLPWLVILNSDVRLRAGVLDRLLAEAGAAQPAICSPQLTTGGVPVPTANLFRAVSVTARLTELLVLARLRESGRLDRWVGFDVACARGERTRTEWLNGACLVLSRAAFDAVGGFDERFHMFCEETDLQWRLREQGVVARLVPSIEVEHRGGASTDPAGRALGLTTSQYVYARKRGFARRLALASWVVDSSNLVYDLARRVSGRPVAPWGTWRHRRRLDGAARRSARTRSGLSPASGAA